jgi:hypothetical protein
MLYPSSRYVELDIALVNVIILKNMSKNPPIFTTHSINPWGMMRRIVGLTISCMKDQWIHKGLKEKHNKKEIMHSSTPQEEETSTLLVDSEEEDEVEVWVEVQVIFFVINLHNQDIWKGIVRTLVQLATTVTCLIMSSKIVQYCWINSRRNEEETNKYN